MRYLITFDTGIVTQAEAQDWNIDRILTQNNDVTEDLSGLPLSDKSLTIFIPSVFTYTNSLAYDGADLGLRVLMYYLRAGRPDVNVVLMGNESKENFLLHYQYPNILKIPAMSYVRFNREAVAHFEILNRKAVKTVEYLPYLKNLGLKFPASLKSTHSLTNEWCLYKWNSFMGFAINGASISGYLFMDYLKTLEKLYHVKDKNVSEYLTNRIKDLKPVRIMVIEDRPEWHEFFRNFFSQTDKVELRCVGEDFKKLKLEDIESKILSEAQDFSPEVVILDFRLMEDRDAEIKEDMREISGYQVLTKVLKGTYDAPAKFFGSQVLIFSATSRIENILMLRKGNADGFLLKERPENYNGKEITRDLISKMVDKLEYAIERAKFLIPLNEKLTILTDLASNPPYSDNRKFGDDVSSLVDSVRLITQSNELNEGVMKLVYLNIFRVFESIKNNSGIISFPSKYSLHIQATRELKVCEHNKSGIRKKGIDDWNWMPKYDGTSAHHKFCESKDLNFAICAVILFRLGYAQVDDTEWNKIRLIRNALAHGEADKTDKRKADTSVDSLKQHSLKMLDLLIEILDHTKIKEVVPNLSGS